MAGTDTFKGQGHVDRVSPRMRKRLALGAVGLAIAAAAIVGYNQAHATPTPASGSAFDTIVVPADACADPDAYEAVQSALSEPHESEANALLALSSEVAARDRSLQEQAWRELDDSTREFQLCLRLVQNEATAGL